MSNLFSGKWANSANRIEYKSPRSNAKCSIAEKKQCALNALEEISEAAAKVREVIPLAREEFVRLLEAGIPPEQAKIMAVQRFYPGVTEQEIESPNTLPGESSGENMLGGARPRAGVNPLFLALFLLSQLQPVEADWQMKQAAAEVKESLQDYAGRGVVVPSAAAGVVTGAAVVAAAIACPACAAAVGIYGGLTITATGALVVGRDLQQNFFENNPVKNEKDAEAVLDVNANRGLPANLAEYFRYEDYRKPTNANIAPGLVWGKVEKDKKKDMFMRAAQGRVARAKERGYQYVKAADGLMYLVEVPPETGIYSSVVGQKLQPPAALMGLAEEQKQQRSALKGLAEEQKQQRAAARELERAQQKQQKGSWWGKRGGTRRRRKSRSSSRGSRRR
jgi:hypothetical protein